MVTNAATAPPLVLPDASRPSRRWSRVAAELLLAVMVALSSVATVVGPWATHSLPGLIATLLPAGFLWLRGRYPVPVLAACVALFGVAAVWATFSAFSVVPAAVALYSVMVRRSRRVGLYYAVGVLLVLVPLASLATDWRRLDPQSVQVAISLAFAAATADAVRNRRAYIAEIVARARHAEATRESEAARRVGEERLRIARDLHDVVAHQISVISLNASVALSSVEANPEKARESLTTIRTASRRVLGDIGDLLAFLRSDDDPGLEPQPGVEQLPDLIDDFLRTGLRVTVRHEGGTPPLSPTAGLVAYRAIQESLTNAAKHGTGGRAHLLLDSTGERVEVLVTNPTSAEGYAGDGFGMSGMRERVASVRGTLDAEVAGGMFRVRVLLPKDDQLQHREGQ